MAESETKAVLAVPVLGKGSISLKQVTEEIVRFTMATSSGQSVILQADGERSTRQILRAVQHCRAQLGLSTEIRVTGKGQHASNGQAERTVQTVRKMANCLRNQGKCTDQRQLRPVSMELQTCCVAGDSVQSHQWVNILRAHDGPKVCWKIGSVW